MATGLRVQIKFKRWDDRNIAIERLKKELDLVVVREIGPDDGIEGILQDLRFVNLAKGFGNIDQVKVLEYKAVQY
jgi:hypothetical protein